MSAVYLTTLGGLWGGSGININAVEVGQDGWIYMAGIDQANQTGGLVVLAYNGGELSWSKTFRENDNGTSYTATLASARRTMCMASMGICLLASCLY